MLNQCINYISENNKQIIYCDQFVTLANISLSPEYKKLVQKKKQYNPVELVSIISEEFGSKLHDANKVDFMRLTEACLRFKEDSKQRKKLVDGILDLCKDVPQISGIYHNEYHNRIVKSALVPIIKHCNTEIETDAGKEPRDMFKTNSWKAYSYLFSLKQVLEYKKDYNHLNFDTLMDLIDVDIGSLPKPDSQPSLLNREFGRHIVNTLAQEENKFKDRHLNLIQKSINKYSVAFPEPQDTYKKCFDIVLARSLKQIYN